MKAVAFGLLLLLGATTFAQTPSDSTERRKKRDPDAPPAWTVRGYLKNLQITTHLPLPDPLPDQTLFSNLVHQRLNVRWYPCDRFTLGWEQRTRIFAGDDVRLDPAMFTDNLERDNGVVDASWVLWSGDAAAIHTRVERFWAEYHRSTWQMRVGRQRINWSVHLVWNPNDVFNAYSFLDFDYEEMPGADAARTTFYTARGTVFDFGYAPGRNRERHIGAARIGFNRWGYDFQVIGGWRFEDAVAGLAWGRQPRQRQLQGEEGSWFRRVLGDDPGDERYALATSIDYSFAKPVYVHVAFLYTSAGTTGSLDFTDFDVLAAPSPAELMPTRYTVLGQMNWTATPLLNVSAAVIYGTGADLLIVYPSITYSIATDWDVLAAGQLFWLGGSATDPDARLTRVVDAVFVRLRWSY